MRESTEHYLNAVTVFSVIDDLRSVLRLYLVLAEMHFLAYDYTNAVVFSRQGLEYVPGSVEARTALAYSLWYEGHPADARAEFNQALGTDAANSLALSGRGQVDVELAARTEHGNFDPALADLGRALGLGLPSPVQEADAHSARAVALAHQGLGQEAEAALHTALAMVPGRSLTLLRAALVRGWGDDHAGARNLLDEAANALPPLSPWHAGLARQARTRWSG